jgi:cyclopropane fatty-acyl-phospholipid synthase-like methyltransferase
MGEIAYVGNELDLFEQANVWKKYFGRFLNSFLKGKILEAGAGIGGTTAALCDDTQDKWLCLEPDPQLYARLENKIREGRLPSCCASIKGTTTDLPPNEKFNAIMYIDVIEHIEKDTEELNRAKALLADKGCLIVLVPAHQFLYNEFDRAIGHYRRYDKKMLKAVAPAGMRLLTIRYLDTLGFISSIMNKYFLKQHYPTAEQVKFWNKFLIPLSKPLDFISGYATGKTLFAVWQKI